MKARENPLGYGGYPSAPALWRQFIAHTGFVLLPAALVLAGLDLRRRGAPDRSSDRAVTCMLLGWAVMTMAVFSVVDWRMTRHLMPVVIAAHLLLVPGRQAPWWRVAAAALTCLWLVAWNARALLGLTRDFAGFVVLPGW